MMLRHAIQMKLDRKIAMYILGILNVPKYIRNQMINEMVKMKLIEKVNRDKIRIINTEKSAKIELNNR